MNLSARGGLRILRSARPGRRPCVSLSARERSGDNGRTAFIDQACPLPFGSVKLHKPCGGDRPPRSVRRCHFRPESEVMRLEDPRLEEAINRDFQHLVQSRHGWRFWFRTWVALSSFTGDRTGGRRGNVDKTHPSSVAPQASPQGVPQAPRRPRLRSAEHGFSQARPRRWRRPVGAARPPARRADALI
jgi:hypothetical protein